METLRKNAEPKLSETGLRAALAELPGWSVKNAKLHREYEFADFRQAMRFLSDAVPAIEELNHHPEWANVYNKVVVDLTTHDSGGITDKDVALAKTLERLAGNLRTN